MERAGKAGSYCTGPGMRPTATYVGGGLGGVQARAAGLHGAPEQHVVPVPCGRPRPVHARQGRGGVSRARVREYPQAAGEPCHVTTRDGGLTGSGVGTIPEARIPGRAPRTMPAVSLADLCALCVAVTLLACVCTKSWLRARAASRGSPPEPV